MMPCAFLQSVVVMVVPELRQAVDSCGTVGYTRFYLLATSAAQWAGVSPGSNGSGRDVNLLATTLHMPDCLPRVIRKPPKDVHIPALTLLACSHGDFVHDSWDKSPLRTMTSRKEKPQAGTVLLP